MGRIRAVSYGSFRAVWRVVRMSSFCSDLKNGFRRIVVTTLMQ
jgi:hypothetical protein